ncbi:hypothetical protein [Halorarius halobius]|uniref:hypothetical protein n=1 Tax=Halorarius halobius TaxID=2962671 RepID=UPI0020CBBB23|nr:hypothetical protein [Halorarius halobius]
MTDCAFCGHAAERHDPVYVEYDGDRLAFCNWACLDQYVDREALTTGTCCVWEPT